MTISNDKVPIITLTYILTTGLLYTDLKPSLSRQYGKHDSNKSRVRKGDSATN